MTNYKESGIEWIAEIPEDWNLSTIGTEFSLRNTKVSDFDYQPLSVTKLQEGVVKQLEDVAKSDAHESRKLVLKNDFVINSRSDRKTSCGLSKYDGSVSLINIVITPKNKIYPNYSHYLLKNNAFAEEFYKWGHGIVADLWTTGWEEMKRISIPLPDYQEQIIITNVIDKKRNQIDTLISLEENEIEKLKEYKQSKINAVVSKGLVKSNIMKESGIEWIGQFPTGWNISRLKYIGKFSGGISSLKPENFGFGYPFINYKNIYKNYVLNQNIEEKANTTLEERKKYNIKYGDLFFTGSSETIDELGYSCVALSDFPDAVYNGFCIRMRPYSFVNYNPKYFLYLTRSHICRNYLSSNDNAITRANLSQSRLGDMPIIFPNIKEQEKSVEYLDNLCQKVEDLILIKQSKIEELQTYKKSLIYEYVTGKKRCVYGN